LEIPGEKTFPVVMELAEAVVRVSEEALVDAMRLILTRMKILVEPTGALGAAAALEGLLPDDVERVGVILSGGNVDPATLAQLLATPNA
jgi:threonine dehydratase